MNRRWLILMLAAMNLMAATEKHVRLVLDISMSMRGTRTEPANDPSGNALLSVGMLYDLARYELGPDGTFQVLPFDSPADLRCPASIPRTAAGPWISPSTAGGRDPFVQKILELPYDAPCTFFFPYLDAGLLDLEKTRKGDDVKRIMILVTDGLTEDKSRGEEARLLRELAPRLRAAEVELFILAFGPKATANEMFFRPIFRFGESAGVAGDLLSDPSGGRLVENMIQIFETSFSYVSEKVSGNVLDLSKGAEQRHVAVLGIYDAPRTPAFAVEAPPAFKAGVSVKGPVATAVGHEVARAIPTGSGRPLSYGVLWINGPSAGGHSFRDAVTPKQLAILRPRNLRVEMAKDALEVAMIESPSKLEVIVRPADGGAGDPGQVNVQFRVFAVKKPDSGYQYHPPEDWIPAATPLGRYVPGKGRVFEIHPVFQEAAAFSKAPDNGKWWDGYVEVRAQSRGNTVATLDKRQHSLRLYPRLSLRPDPNRATAMNGRSATLEGGREGCTTFSFQVEGSPRRETDYTLSAVVEAKTLPAPMRGAKFRLNGVDLKQWENGRKIGLRSLTGGKFELCLTAPKRTGGGKDLETPVKFALWMADDDSYRKLEVVEPLTLVANLQPMGVFSRFLALWLLLLVLVLLWWLWTRLRQMLGFPDDFRVALADGARGGLPSPHVLAEPAIWDTLVRGRPPRPVSSLNGKLLGNVIPVDDDLYTFQPSRGFTEVTRDGHLLSRREGGSMLLAVHQTYHVKGNDGSLHQLRLEYTPRS